jgi:predicted GIY-YIG superfamily endonuclease
MKTYVYLIQNGRSHIKIGVSANPVDRMRELQTASSKPLRLLASFPFKSREEAFGVEQELHKKFNHLLISGEWFKRCLIREMRAGGKRIIGGTYKDPITRLHHE